MTNTSRLQGMHFSYTEKLSKFKASTYLRSVLNTKVFVLLFRVNFWKF